MHCRQKKSAGATGEGAADMGPGFTAVSVTTAVAGRGSARAGEKQRRRITVEMPKVWAGGVRGRDSSGCCQASNKRDGGGGFQERNGGMGGTRLDATGESWTRKLRKLAEATGVLRCGGVLILPVEKSAWLRLLGLRPPCPPEPERNVSSRHLRRARLKKRREAGEEGKGGKGGAREEEQEGEARAPPPPRKALTQSHLDTGQNGPLRDWVREKDRLARRGRADVRRRKRAEREEKRRKKLEGEGRARESEQKVRSWMERKRKEEAEAQKGNAGAKPLACVSGTRSETEDCNRTPSSRTAEQPSLQSSIAPTPAGGADVTHRTHRHLVKELQSHDTKLTSLALQVGPRETPVSEKGRSKKGEGQRRPSQSGHWEDNRTKQVEEKGPKLSLSPDYLDMSTGPSEVRRASEKPASDSNGKSKAAAGVISPPLKDRPGPNGVKFRRRLCSGQLGALTSQTNRSSAGERHRETHDEWFLRKAEERRMKKEERMQRSEAVEQDPQMEELFLKLARGRLEAKLNSRRRVDSGQSASQNAMTPPLQQSETRSTPEVHRRLPEILYQNAPGSPSSEHKGSQDHLFPLRQPSQHYSVCSPNSNSGQRRAGAIQQLISCLSGSHREQRKGGA